MTAPLFNVGDVYQLRDYFDYVIVDVYWNPFRSCWGYQLLTLDGFVMFPFHGRRRFHYLQEYEFLVSIVRSWGWMMGVSDDSRVFVVIDY